VAERFDQIHAIDRWVIEHAVAVLGLLPAEQSIEINLSGRSLGDPGLVSHISDVIAACAVDPDRLIFELTETAAIENIHRASTFVDELTALGCHFALDDFGAGFGSFYYLKYLPFDYLKIDGEFVKNCTESRTDQLIIQSCVQLARGLGKQTIAEFVENAEILRLVRALGVDHAQGYEIARPLRVDEVLAQAALP
jgi:EAL domain-containing protein (putative c-di-GMP-specific phosphodiesterase class I)